MYYTLCTCYNDVGVASSTTELPIPTVGQLAEVKELCSRFVRATNPTELGYTYDEIKGFDEVNVTLLPEKKGNLLNKHNEYTVQSKVGVARGVVFLGRRLGYVNVVHVHVYV